MTRAIQAAALAAVLAVGAAGSIQAGIIYDNLLTDSYSPTTGFTVSGTGSVVGSFTHTETFVAAVSGTEADIKVAMWWASAGNSTADFTLTLKDSSSNVLDVLQGTAPSNTSTVPVVKVFTTLSPVLLAGQTYTLTATPTSATTFDAWEHNSDSVHPGTSGFRVETAVTAVPEPATLAGAASAVVMGLGYALRRRKRAA